MVEEIVLNGEGWETDRYPLEIDGFDLEIVDSVNYDRDGHTIRDFVWAGIIYLDNKRHTMLRCTWQAQGGSIKVDRFTRSGGQEPEVTEEISGIEDAYAGWVKVSERFDGAGFWGAELRRFQYGQTGVSSGK